MSNVNAELEQLKRARASLEKFRLKLLRPSVATLESGSSDLVIALECMKRLEPALASRGRRSASLEQSLQSEVANLRRELQQVNALMEGAGKFYEGWSRLLSPTADDQAVHYTANGKQSASGSKPSHHVVIHG